MRILQLLKDKEEKEFTEQKKKKEYSKILSPLDCIPYVGVYEYICMSEYYAYVYLCLYAHIHTERRMNELG